MIMKYLQSVVCVMVMNFVTAEEWRHPKRQIDEYSYRTEETFNEHGFHLSSLDLYRFRKILPMLPIKGTPLENLVEYAKSSKGQNLDFNLNELFIHNKEAMMAILQESPRNVEQFSASDGINVDIDDIPDPEERNQIQGWEGCRRDYDTIMLPETQAYYKIQVLIANDNPFINIPVPEVPEALNATGFMIESIGRRPAGYSQGALMWVGVPEICGSEGVQYTWNETEVRQFKGKYARISVPLETTSVPTIWPLAIGVCAPDTCSDEDIARYASQENEWMLPYLTDSLLPRNVTIVYSGQKIDLATDTAAKGVVAYLIIMIVLVIIASCYDGWGRQREIRRHIKRNIGGDKGKSLTVDDIQEADEYLYGKPSFRERFETGFAGFSFYSNIRHIYNEESRDRIEVLDGIKAISYLWIVKGMSYVYGVVYFETWTSLNFIDALGRYFDEWSTMATISMPYGNSSLFFVSGFLCVHLYYKAFKRNNEKFTPWFFIRFFLHRFWSLAPSIMGMLVVFTWFYRYLGDGPINSPDVSDAEKCKKTWWLAGLMFNNLFKTDTQCFAWDWYYGCIFQLHLVSIAVVAPLVLLPVAGYVMVGLMYIAHIVVLAIWQTKSYDGEGVEWFWDILQTPWCNAGPYAIGMMFAMIIKNSDRNKKWHWAPILILWLCSVAGILTVIYAPWDQYKDDTREWTRVGEIAFKTLAPQIMALCVGWITFACWKGYGGIVRNLLSWRFFHFMSKMLLPMTVFMGPVMQKYFLGRRQPFYIHENHMSHVYFGHLLSLFVFANLIALIFTYPVSRGVIHAVRAKTRLELFLWARHPDILSGLTGDPDIDRPQLDKIAAKETKNRANSHRYITGEKVNDVRQAPPPYDNDLYEKLSSKANLGYHVNNAYQSDESSARL